LKTRILVNTIRLVDVEKAQQWNSRGHFFAAAAEAMRRILIDQARHKRSKRAGGENKRIELTIVEPEIQGAQLELLAFDEALQRLSIEERLHQASGINTRGDILARNNQGSPCLLIKK
jgi:hypothetical protein